MKLLILSKVFILSILSIASNSCSDDHPDKKGFAVVTEDDSEDNEESKDNGLTKDTLDFATRPKNVLKTAFKNHRLTPVFKINYSKSSEKFFTGSVAHHSSYSNDWNSENNVWNGHIIPGLEAVYGYNMVNVSHTNLENQSKTEFFEKPVLIKTLYYPSFSKDTLNNQPIKRNYYLVSAYDEDTNKDGFINLKDLRRFYYLDINAKNKTLLIPKSYSVISSEYDSANDYLYVFAKKDDNKNGKSEAKENVKIFWIDLKAPVNIGEQY